MRLRIVLITVAALIAFAFNSILTRLALGARELDAAAFTAVRICAGALVLLLLVRFQSRSWEPLRARGAIGPLALFAYAAPFSFAYLRIGAAVGALVLFGTVQLTMIGYALVRGERPTPITWCGIVIAIGGLLVLTAPAVGRPDPLGVLLMTIAGVAWGAYTIAGRGIADPLAANARSFLWSAPLALLLALVMPSTIAPTPRGIALALLSGAVTSGIGYAIWYRAVRHLTVTEAAVAQMTVPVIAAVAAILLLHERLTLRLVESGVTVLAGVAMVVAGRRRA
jgi:drug/metabolite transporter (DMT)-like permease